MPDLQTHLRVQWLSFIAFSTGTVQKECFRYQQYSRVNVLQGSEAISSLSSQLNEEKRKSDELLKERHKYNEEKLKLAEVKDHLEVDV